MVVTLYAGVRVTLVLVVGVGFRLAMLDILLPGERGLGVRGVGAVDVCVFVLLGVVGVVVMVCVGGVGLVMDLG